MTLNISSTFLDFENSSNEKVYQTRQIRLLFIVQ